MKKITNGLLVILEGGEGVGKTTQAKALVDYYRSQGYSAKYFREPGGDELAEQIRNMVLYNEMDVNTEILLMSAARNINVQNNILPALTNGNIVILDRFTISTMVYQGLLKNGDMDFIAKCTKQVTQDLYDNDSCSIEFTLLCDPNVAIERAAAEGHERNKHDILPIEDYKKINDGYFLLSCNDKYKRFKNNNCFYKILDTSTVTKENVLDQLKFYIDALITISDIYEEHNNE